MADITIFPSLEVQMLLNNKASGFEYRRRREEDWRENYELYRDKVTINRLIQRQSVNIPLMKTTLRTLLKDIDDMPVIVFENRDNDKQAEIFQNEYWKLTLENNNAELQDIVDKKQDFFFGRTFDSMQVEDGKIVMDIEDPEDILVDRFMNPYNIDSSRFLIHTHIFKPLSVLKNNPDYDKEEIKKLEEFFKTQMGIVKAQDNENSLQQKNQKLSDLGVADVEDPVLGETYVELTMHRVFREAGEEWKDENGKKHKTETDQIFHYVEAQDMVMLMKKPQEVVIGVTKDHYWQNHYNYNTWGDDIDKQDFWTDGIADIVRTPNHILNSNFSQEVERRTLANFGMHYYDASLKDDGFVPSTFNPVSWGWYPVPANGKKLSDVFQKVDLGGVPGNLEFSIFVIDMVNNATGASAAKQGAKTPGDKTKFEINAVLTEATERTQGMSKFYTECWEQRATKFLKLIEAAADRLDAVKIYKKGRNTNDLFEREISPKDWMTKSGYQVKVWSQDEKKARDTDSLTKLNAVMMNMPDNPKLREVYQRKLLEFADLAPEEINEIMQYEQQKLMMMGNGTMGLPLVQQGMQGQINPLQQQLQAGQQLQA